MLNWYNILNPSGWPGVNINTGNNKIDGRYYNLLSSNHVSLAASGSMLLAANSGIKLISPSFVEASGIRANRILAENFGKIGSNGQLLPLYSGPDNGIVFKNNDNNLSSNNIITYNSGQNTIQFPAGADGGVLYIRPSVVIGGVALPANKSISSFNEMRLTPASTDTEGQIITPANINFSIEIEAGSGIKLGPNSNLNSYSGFLLTHDGSGRVAQWKPATYLKENYNTSLALDGLERVGVSLIRFPKRPALIKDGKLYIYTSDRVWSPYPAITDLEQMEQEFGSGDDTLCIETALGEKYIGYTKFAYTAKAASQQDLNISYNFNSSIITTSITDPNETRIFVGPSECFQIEIVPPKNPASTAPNELIGDTFFNSNLTPPEGTNVFVFSVTKGGYLPMQIENPATGIILFKNDNLADLQQASGLVEFADDGTPLAEPRSIPLRFKPSTLNNISVRPDVHTAFNMLGENIDFIVYGKYKTDFNNYDSIFNLNENLIPSGLTPVFKIDAMLVNSVSGSPSGVQYTKFIDRDKTVPTGWYFDQYGKVCIRTNDAYILASIPSGSQTLNTYADLTINGHTFTNSLVAEDIFLRPKPLANNQGKYIRNALLTINSEGQIVSRTPRVNPVVPAAPSGVAGILNGHGGLGNNEHSIRWDAPLDDGRSKIINYLIQLSFNDGENWINVPTDNILVYRGFNTQTSATISQVPSSAIFRVAAQNGVGIGPYSESTEISFISNTGLPQSPTNFNVSRYIESLELSEASLSWTATNNWGSLPASGYLIEESTDDGLTWYNRAFISYDSATEYTETGLDGITNYLYRISSVNSNNNRSAYNFVYTTGVLTQDPDLEEEENKKNDVLSNFDFGQILFTGICSI